MTNLGGTGVSENTDFDDEVTALLARQDRLNPLTLAAWQADPRAQLDDVVTTAERSTGNGGGGTGAIIASGTENGLNIVKHNTLNLSFDLRLTSTIDVKQLGALVSPADATLPIQHATVLLATAGGTVDLTDGDFLISRNVGTVDRWGIKIESSNIRIKGDGATLKRFDTDISTFALAYPIIFIGKPDVDDSSQSVDGTMIEGIRFIGEDTRGPVDGQSLSDFKTAIAMRNTRDTTMQNNKFTFIDSHAIFCIHPAEFDNATAAFYNTTKNYNLKILNNDFIGQPHAIPQRGRLYCCHVTGLDHLIVDSNYFEWTDDAVFGLGTYSNYEQNEDDEFLPDETGWVLGNVKRGGRDWTVSNNVMLNNSEHAIYLEGMNCTATGNNIYSEDATITTEKAITVRGFGMSVTGNTISNYGTGIGISRFGTDIVISGNSIQVAGPNCMGVNVDAQNLSAVIDNRVWFDVLVNKYVPFSNINITGNTFNFSVEVATGDDDVGVRLSTDGFDANFPNGQILGVNITGNSFNNYFKGVLFTNVEYRNCLVSGNVFTAKEFTEARFNSAVISGATQANPVVITATAHGYNDGDTVTINDVVGMTELNGNTYTVANKNVNDFELSGIDGTAFTAYGSVGTASTEMNTYAPLAQADSNARLQNCAFFNNIVYGATYLYATATGGGGAGTVPTPRGFCGNTLQFIKNIKTADIAISSIETNFTNNTGKAFLDRDYGEHDIQNSLSDASFSGSSARKYCFRFVTGSTVRFHIDDTGGVRSF